MTLTSSLKAGFDGAWRRPKLVATVWTWNLLVALGAAMPFLRWLRGTLPQAPEADLLAHRFSFSLFAELLQDSGPALVMAWAAALGAALLGFLASPLLAGGVLEVLGSRDERPFLHRFFRGAGHFYGRFLRLLLMSTLAAVLVAGVLAALAGLAVRPLRDSAWEPGGIVANLLVMLVVVAVLGFSWLALDYARIQVSRDDSRRMWRAFRSGMRFVAHFRGTTVGILVVAWLLLGALGAAYWAFRYAVPSHTAGLIALMFVAQQAFMLARTGLRVATVAAERELHVARRPAVGLTPLPERAEPVPIPVEIVMAEPALGGTA